MTDLIEYHIGDYCLTVYIDNSYKIEKWHKKYGFELAEPPVKINLQFMGIIKGVELERKRSKD